VSEHDAIALPGAHGLVSLHSAGTLGLLQALSTQVQAAVISGIQVMQDWCSIAVVIAMCALMMMGFIG
jgi:hypothetical protein